MAGCLFLVAHHPGPRRRSVFSCCAMFYEFGMCAYVAVHALHARSRTINLTVWTVSLFVCVCVCVCVCLCLCCAVHARLSEHAHAFQRVVQSGGFLTTPELVLFELTKDSRDPSFRAISKLAKKEAEHND